MQKHDFAQQQYFVQDISTPTTTTTTRTTFENLNEHLATFNCPSEIKENKGESMHSTPSRNRYRVDQSDRVTRQFAGDQTTSYALHQCLFPMNTTASITRHKSNHSADRFIPNSKVSSSYYSLLLAETEAKARFAKQDKKHSSDEDVDDESYSISKNGNSNKHCPMPITEDNYTELLRNNIFSEMIECSGVNRQASTSATTNSSSNSTHNCNNFSFAESRCTTIYIDQKHMYLSGVAETPTGLCRAVTPKVLSYKLDSTKTPRRKPFIATKDTIQFSDESQKEERKIHNKPYKILDAPGLDGDFYTNILDWTKQNLVVVALNNQVYTWSPARLDVTNLSGPSQQGKAIVSLASNSDGMKLATGDESGFIKIFDIEKSRQTMSFQSHSERIGAISWNDNLLTTASKDNTIKIRDIRSKSHPTVLSFHKEQVCGIKWSEDGVNLASGGNDNKVCVYNLKANKLSSVFSSHNGAVKALAWSPHQHNILASGGGNRDQTLKFWNTQTNQLIKSVHTGSQICNMHFSKNHNEIATTHGFQLNQISVWRADTFSQVATLYGHSERVLYLAASPDNEDIVTGSADETLRFWKVFNKRKQINDSNGSSRLDSIYSNIR